MLPRRPNPLPRLALPSLFVAAALVGCGLAPRKTTRDDCEALADRFAEVARDAQEAADRRCAVKPTAEEREEERRVLGDLREDLARACGEHVGASHAARDAQCLETAKGVEGLRACAFATPFFHELSAHVLAAEKLVELRCKARTTGGTPKPDAHPEEDAGKKKPDPKKKKDD